MNNFNSCWKLLGSKALITVLFCGTVHAAPVASNGSGSVVSVDRIATFDSLSDFNVADLGIYTENQLNIQTPTSHPNYALPLCAPCWYANGGYDSFSSQSASLAIISTTDAATMTAIEFNLFSGFSIGTNTLIWETYLNNTLTGSGSFTWLGAGSLVSWSDTAGIDELRVGLFDYSGQISNTDNHIGIDDLKVQLAPVPVPPAIWLLGSGLLGLIGFTKRKKSG